MIAVDRQDRVEVYLASEGSIIAQQGVGDAEPQTIAVRPENVDLLIRALREARRSASSPATNRTE